MNSPGSATTAKPDGERLKLMRTGARRVTRDQARIHAAAAVAAKRDLAHHLRLNRSRQERLNLVGGVAQAHGLARILSRRRPELSGGERTVFPDSDVPGREPADVLKERPGAGHIPENEILLERSVA
jgi:hypothetical protein